MGTERTPGLEAPARQQQQRAHEEHNHREQSSQAKQHNHRSNLRSSSKASAPPGKPARSGAVCCSTAPARSSRESAPSAHIDRSHIERSSRQTAPTSGRPRISASTSRRRRLSIARACSKLKLSASIAKSLHHQLGLAARPATSDAPGAAPRAASADPRAAPAPRSPLAARASRSFASLTHGRRAVGARRSLPPLRSGRSAPRASRCRWGPCPSAAGSAPGKSPWHGSCMRRGDTAAAPAAPPACRWAAARRHTTPAASRYAAAGLGAACRRFARQRGDEAAALMRPARHRPPAHGGVARPRSPRATCSASLRTGSFAGCRPPEKQATARAKATAGRRPARAQPVQQHSGGPTRVKGQRG